MAGTGANAAGSPEYNIQTGVTQDKIPMFTHSGKMRYSRVIHTVDANSGTGTGGALVDTDEINLIQLPPNCRLFGLHSAYSFSATQGASTTIDVGVRAYTQVDGTAVAELHDGLNIAMIATVLVVTEWPIGTFGASFNADDLGTFRFDSKLPVTIFMTCNDAGGTYDGDLTDIIRFGFWYEVD